MGYSAKRLDFSAGIQFILKIWIIISTILAFAFVPYKEIQSQSYLQYKLYGTVLSFYQSSFFKSALYVLIGIGIFVLVAYVVKPLRKKDKFPFSNRFIKLNKSFIFTSLFLLIAALCFVLNSYPLMKTLRQGPNVMIIIVDTLRSDFADLENSISTRTPQIKKTLMPDSYFFKNTFSNSPWTLPSVSSLLTSQYPSLLGIDNFLSRLDPKKLTLAEILKNQGYFTYGIVSHILLQKQYGLDQGFDIYNERNITDEFFNHNSISSPDITHDAIQFINSNRNKKFFMLLHYFDPHYTYINHEPSTSYSGEFTSSEINYLRDLISANKHTAEDIQYLRDSYGSEIVFTDFYIGKVIETLKSNKIYDDTLIVFTSDHGEEFVEKGWLGHSTTVYNEQIKIPMLFKPPHDKLSLQTPPKNQVVSNIDIAPSVLSVLDISQPLQFQGHTIFSNTSENRYVFSEVVQREYGEFKNRACVIGNGWKLIYDFVAKEYELFNLMDDIHESKNVLGSNEDIEQSLKLKLSNWIHVNRIQQENLKKRKNLSEAEKKKLKSLGYLK